MEDSIDIVEDVLRAKGFFKVTLPVFNKLQSQLLRNFVDEFRIQIRTAPFLELHLAFGGVEVERICNVSPTIEKIKVNHGIGAKYNIPSDLAYHLPCSTYTKPEVTLQHMAHEFKARPVNHLG
ncbi:hypothetical protein ES703_119939 [subsurface metagenome]